MFRLVSKRALLYTLAIAASCAASYAQDGSESTPITVSAPAPCNTPVTIAVSFSFSGVTPAQAKNELDDRLYKLNGFLLQNHIDKLETLAMCYKVAEQDVNADKNGRRVPPHSRSQPAADKPTTYVVTGNAEYQIDSSDSAFKLGQFFTQQKFVVTVSNKPTKAASCPGAVAKPVAKPEPEKSGLQTRGRKKQDNELNSILREAPPADEKEPASNDNAPRENGQAPQLPGLGDEPPDAEPLQEKR